MSIATDIQDFMEMLTQSAKVSAEPKIRVVEKDFSQLEIHQAFQWRGKKWAKISSNLAQSGSIRQIMSNSTRVVALPFSMFGKAI